MKKLSKQVALITGAGSGIGKEIAKLYALNGAKIVAADYNDQRLASLSDEIIAVGGEVLVVPVDITQQEGINFMIDATINEFGTLDILVNNAGVMDNFEPVHELSDIVYEKVMKINVEAPFKISRAALEIFLPKKRGVIINLASLAGLNGVRGGAAYTMSKHAIVGLTKNTAYIYAKRGIRCNALAPGGVMTNIQQTIDQNKVSQWGREMVMPGLSINPRLGDPAEVAAVALFLAGKDSSFVNGEILAVDAGWNAY